MDLELILQLLESGYYEVYNQENVLLVDLNLTPIKRITKKGIQTSDKEYEFNLLIYATGFDGVTGPYDRIDIRHQQDVVSKMTGATFQEPCLACRRKVFQICL